jgi:hypothetical protein
VFGSHEFCTDNRGYWFLVGELTTTPSCTTTPAPLPPPPGGGSWSQKDLGWASSPYDHANPPKNKIGDQGCTLLSDNYGLNYAGEQFNPITLNKVFNDLGVYSPPKPGVPNNGGAIDQVLGVSGASGGALSLDVKHSGSNKTQDLDAYLCANSPAPVIVQVPNPGGLTGQHYIVVTGQITGQTQGDYSIVDPGFAARRKLSDYSTFSIAGAVEAGDPSVLAFRVDEAATLLVTAPDGTQTGIDPSNGEILKGSPQAAYSAVDNSIANDTDSIPPTETTHFVDYNLPTAGTYTVQVEGLQLGDYRLTVTAADNDGKPQTSITTTGIANAGTLATFQVAYAPATGAPSTTVVATFASTLGDIANSLAIGLIDNSGIAGSLSSKIQAAQSATAGGQNRAAVNILKSFMNELSAQTGKHITGVAPQVLQDDAASLITQLTL